MARQKSRNTTVPTHRLCVLDRATGQRGQVGAAWLQADGSVRIKLEYCVVLDSRLLDDCLITLFPIGESTAKKIQADMNPTFLGEDSVENIRDEITGYPDKEPY